MFNIPIKTMTDKDRQKGKVAELALGYQGGAKALEKMEEALGANLGLSYQEMETTVEAWRKANSEIVSFWQGLEEAAKKSIQYKKMIIFGRFVFTTDDKRMTIQLPSGRVLSYWKARLAPNKYGRPSIQYMWADTVTRKWTWVDTYGGKIAENVTQAVARDFMAEAVIKVHEAGHTIVMHIHDEIVVENGSKEELENLMKELPIWASGFPLDAKGEEVKYFQK